MSAAKTELLVIIQFCRQQVAMRTRRGPPRSMDEARQAFRYGICDYCALTGEPCVGRWGAFGYLLGYYVLAPLMRSLARS